MKQTNFYTQGQRRAARVFLALGILASYNTARVLAAPESEQPIGSAMTTKPCGLKLSRVDTSPAMATPVGTPLIAQGGHRVTLLQNHGSWQAEVDENLPVGFSRKLHLPVYIERGTDWQQLATYSEAIQRQRVAVDFTPGSGYVYVGSRGLRGGNQQILHVAVAQGELAQVRKILEKGKVNINAVDEQGQSALHWAVIMDQKEIAVLLLMHGAHVALKDHYSQTALDYATADDARYFSKIAALVQSFSTPDDLIVAGLADGGTRKQVEIDQKLKEIRSRLGDLDKETQGQKQYRYFKYRYYALKASYLKAIGNEEKASCQAALAKKYKEPDNTGLATISLAEDEQETLAAPSAASKKADQILDMTDAMVLYKKQGDDSWTRAIDCWYAQQGAWDLLTILGKEDLAHLSVDQLNALRLKNARLAHALYASCCWEAAKKYDLRCEINLRGSMALRLYAIGRRLKAKIYALATCRKLLDAPFEVLMVQDLMKAQAMAAKLQGCKPVCNATQTTASRVTNTWEALRELENTEKRSYLLPVHKAYSYTERDTLKEAINKDLQGIIKGLLLNSDRNLVKLQVSREEILWAQKRAKRYKQAGVVTILASGVFLWVLLGPWPLSLVLKFSKHVNHAPQLAWLVSLGFCSLLYLGRSVLKYGRSLSGKGRSMIQETEGCKNINAIMNQALAYHDQGNIKQFMNRLTRAYATGTQFLSPESLRYGLPVERIIESLTKHGFRPDGIACLLNLMGEVLSSGKVSIPDGTSVALDYRIDNSFYGALDKKLEASAKDLDKRVSEICKKSIANAVKSYFHELKNFLLLRDEGYLTREHLEDSREMPFSLRLEVMRNIAKTNIAIFHAISYLTITRGAQDRLIAARRLASEVRSSIDQYSQSYPNSSRQLVLKQLATIEELLDI